MARNGLARFVETLRGFSGLGGVRWIGSVLCDRTPAAPEDLTLTDVLPADARHLMVGGREVAVREKGEGEPAVIFLHGFAEYLDTWRPVQEVIARRHRTIALDLWGFGASARPADAKPLQWVDEVIGVMDQLDVPRAVLVGHSLGGRVSLMTARAHPDRVAGLVLVAADWGQAPQGYVMVWLLAHTPALGWLLGKIRASREQVWRLGQRIITPNHTLTPETLDALYLPRRVKGSVACWRSLGRAAPLRDVRGLADAVRCPAVALWGVDDPVVPVWAGRKLAGKLGCELTEFDQCGHFVAEEYPEETAAVIERFLAGLPSAGQS